MTHLAPTRRLVSWLAPALLLGTLALAACGSTTGGTSTGTPGAATIMQRAKDAKITDETFTVSLSGTSAGEADTATINGKLTTNPKREQIDTTAQSGSTNLALTLIEDGATSLDYIKFTEAGSIGVPTGQWFKMSSSTGESLSGSVDWLLDFSKMSNVKLVGSEQVNGVATWHLTATITFDATPTPGTATTQAQAVAADLYLRQDNYYPVKMNVKSTGTDTSIGEGTVTWTAINSGISIELPDPSEVTTLPGA